MNAKRIGFRHHLRAEVVPGDATYLVSEHGVTALRAPGLETVAPLLDGSRDLDALHRDHPGGLPASHLAALVQQLADAGFVEYREHEEPPGPDARSAAAYFELAGLAGHPAAVLRAEAEVELRTVGDVDAAAVLETLGAGGLRVRARPAPGARLTVVVCDDYLHPALAAIDTAHRATGRPWLPAKPVGTTLWVGPVFRPGSACWSCLAQPLRLHRAMETEVRAAAGGPPPGPAPPAAGLPATRAAGLQLLAVEAAKWLAGYRHPGQDSVLTFDTLTLAARLHPLRRSPRCRQCGNPLPAIGPGPVVLRPRRRAPGGHRARSAEEIMSAYGHLASPVTGIVGEIARVEGGPAFLNSFCADAHPIGAGRGPAALRQGLADRIGGKGTTELEARVSVLCESVERYSACLHGDEPRLRAGYASLGDKAVHPDDCQLFAPAQFDRRAETNARQGGFQYVPEPFDEHAEIDWTPVWSLTEDRARLLPTGLLYFPPVSGDVPSAAGAEFCCPDSNGNAAGASLEDAVLQGFLELVERDAVALWWYNRTRQPAVDLHAVAAADLWTEQLLDTHGSLHREVWALDLTSDFGIPVIGSFSRRTDRTPEDIVFGFGAHMDPRIALRRSLTELNQVLPAVLGGGAGPHGYACADPAAVDWWRTATVADQPYLLPAAGVRARRLADFPRRTAGADGSADLGADVDAAVEAVRRRGLHLLVLDQTRPETALPVVKVVVPGLRSFWARFAPGRLFDVPVRLGRLPRPHTAEELNPVPLFV